MSPTDVVLFGVTLFLALAMLIKWKRRRVMIARRVNRGLRGYVSGKPVQPASPEDDEADLVGARKGSGA